MNDNYELNPTEFKEGDGEVIPHEPPTNDRSHARRIALQVLYEIDSAGHEPADVLISHLQGRQVGRRVARSVYNLVRGVVGNRSALDATIAQFAPEWPVNQMAIVDRNILRIAIFEFAVQAKTPVGVAIDEAVTLARLFGADNSMGFVNGVLGAIADDPATLQNLRLPDADTDEDDVFADDEPDEDDDE